MAALIATPMIHMGLAFVFQNIWREAPAVGIVYITISIYYISIFIWVLT